MWIAIIILSIVVAYLSAEVMSIRNILKKEIEQRKAWSSELAEIHDRIRSSDQVKTIQKRYKN